MSLWTPSGEYEVPDQDAPGSGRAHPGGPLDTGGRVAPGGAGSGDPGDNQVDVEELARRLAEAPAEVVVANHCYGLFELAAVYLSQTPPHLEAARLSIDALGYLIEGLAGRLGDAEAELLDALHQIRLAFVQIAATAVGSAGGGDGVGPQAGPDTGA